MAMVLPKELEGIVDFVFSAAKRKYSSDGYLVAFSAYFQNGVPKIYHFYDGANQTNETICSGLIDIFKSCAIEKGYESIAICTESYVLGEDDGGNDLKIPAVEIYTETHDGIAFKVFFPISKDGDKAICFGEKLVGAYRPLIFAKPNAAINESIIDTIKLLSCTVATWLLLSPVLLFLFFFASEADVDLALIAMKHAEGRNLEVFSILSISLITAFIISSHLLKIKAKKKLKEDQQ